MSLQCAYKGAIHLNIGATTEHFSIVVRLRADKEARETVAKMAEHAVEVVHAI